MQRHRACMTKICIIATFIMVLACRAAAQSTDDSGTKVKIIALEQLWYQSFQSHDTRAIDSILDNTVLLVNSDGSMQTKAAFLADMRTRFSKPLSSQTVTVPESVQVRVFGTTALAIGLYRVRGIDHGHAYSRRERFMDTWKYRSGAWVIVGSQATPVLR